MSVKLTDAIAGNRRWLARAAVEHNELCAKAHEFLDRAATLSKEIVAREKMAEAMENVQRLMPDNTTINFLVPGDG